MKHNFILSVEYNYTYISSSFQQSLRLANVNYAPQYSYSIQYYTIFIHYKYYNGNKILSRLHEFETSLQYIILTRRSLIFY